MKRASLWCGLFAGFFAVIASAGDMDEVLQHLISHHQGWGELGVNTCAHAPNTEPLPLRIGETSYEKGIGTHAPGELVFMLDGQFKAFTADLGVQPQNNGAGSVTFEIAVDGETRFTSETMREKDAPVPVSIDVTGADELRIIVGDAGDGIACDVANIGNPTLARNPDVAELKIDRLEIAPYAWVKAWAAGDTGTETERTGPFIADDVYMGRPVAKDAQGGYPVPVDAEGTGSIGLEWPEQRLLREVAFVADPALLPLDSIGVQIWIGESPWQGTWHDVECELSLDRNRFHATLGYPKDTSARRGHEKVRWVIKDCPPDLRIDGFSATTFSRTRSATLRVDTKHNDLGAPSVYNGVIRDLQSPTEADSRKACLALTYSDSRLWKADATVLRFDVPGQPVAVAVDDVLAEGYVYVPSAGLLVARDDVSISLDEAEAAVANTPSLLDRVRTMPDQTFEQAMEHVHNPIQDLGPMILSLACDNRKFVAHRDGSVTFEPYDEPDEDVPLPAKYRCRLEVRYDGSVSEPEARTLRGDWLPAPLSTWRRGDVTYTQCVYVAPLNGDAVDPEGWLYPQAACVVEIEARNEGNAPANASTDVVAFGPADGGTPAAFDESGASLVCAPKGRVLVMVLPSADSALDPGVHPGGGVGFSGELEPGETARMQILLPAWKLLQDDAGSITAGDAFDSLATYWQHVMAPAMDVEVPNPFLTNLIRASQVHCLLAARNEERGDRVAAWISSDRYGPLESEAHAVIRGMDLFGHDAYARRSLDYFIHRYAPEGFLTTGYTIMGTGWHLWTLAEHVARSGDTQWLERIAPDVARACQWIVDERKKTMNHPGYPGASAAEHPGDACPPECGLMPPTVAADWNRYAYRFFQEGHYYAGLKEAGEALDAIGWEGAETFETEADALREATLRAYRYTQGRAPAQALDTGAWIPAYPGMLYSFGRIEDIIPGEDWNRSWCYDVELGAHHLAALGVLDPTSDEVGNMLEHMEEFWFLHQGMGDYPEETNHEDWFNLGGFAKVQPYYARNAELYAMRDDVKPFIRSYFNTIPTLVSRENLSFWEHFHNIGGWNKTHETGYFLAQTREMLVQERDGALWLAPLVTDRWLEDGETISVANAPTGFGPVSYTVASHVSDHRIDVAVETALRTQPTAVVVRLRHPEGRDIASVEAEGVAPENVKTRSNEVVLAPPLPPQLSLRVHFAE